MNVASQNLSGVAAAYVAGVEPNFKFVLYAWFAVVLNIYPRIVISYAIDGAGSIKGRFHEWPRFVSRQVLPDYEEDEVMDVNMHTRKVIDVV